jgi:flagellar FliL protein
MAQAEVIDGQTAAKPSRRGLFLGLALMVVLGGGGFAAVRAGLILAPHDGATGSDGTVVEDPELPDIAFVPLEPVVVSLTRDGTGRHLRFAAQLEVGKHDAEEVAHLVPRVVDVLNDYLRAVDPDLLDRPDALIRLRAQILRRIKLVAGEGRVRDLLVSEFVIN